MKKSTKNIYYDIGLDIGTNSVGYAVTDIEGNLVKIKGKNFWGVRLFDEGKTAATRRLYRSTRRRKARRKQRIKLLQQIFHSEIAAVDPDFYKRLKASFLHKDDRGHHYNLLIEESLNDRAYYGKYPTIYHLRYDLITSKDKFDIRLIYLALHHIVKYRGNFLYEGQKMVIEDVGIRDDVYNYLNYLKEKQEVGFDFTDEDISGFITFITDNTKTKRDKLNKLPANTRIPEINKALKEFNKAILGNKFKLSVLFMEEQNDFNMEISFSDDFDEDLVISILNDKEDLYQSVKKIYSNLVLLGIRGKYQYISQSMIERYEKHKQDLRILKDLFKKYYPEEYNNFFRLPKDDKKEMTNYATYIKHPGKHTLDKLHKGLKKILETRKEELKDNLDYKYCLEEIENESFLKILNTKDNAAIPYQLHLLELEKIIENQSRYYPVLEKEKDKLISLVSFRIPYYVGPLNQHSPFSWLVRKDEKIYPWNFNEVVNVEKSAEKFIERMRNNCTYLPDEPVLPKKSLLISEFNLLDELNKVRVDGNLIPEDTKKEIIKKLFKTRKTVSEKALINFYKQKGIIVERIEGLRKEKEFSASLSSYIDFVNIFGKVDESNYEMIENIINWITLFTDKKILKSKILREYPQINPEQLKKIEKLNYSGWARLSKKLIDGIMVKDEKGNRVTILDVMRNTNFNFMQIINDEKLGFKEIIEKHNREQFSQKITLEDVNNLQGSPAIKKAIWQTIKIVDEIITIMQTEPANIYFEVTRSVKESKRTKSRVDKLLDLYEKISEETDFFNKDVFLELKNEKKKNAKLDNEKLFLYYIQNGKCMYSGKPLDIDRLSLYEIDHILPRSLVKDDSIDNKALVIPACNQRKGADLLLDYDLVIQRMRPFWDFLYRNKLISWKKYNNLTRTTITEAEAKQFINRQLVETSQININVINLLHNCYKNVDIKLVKSQLVSQCRQELQLYKLREINDYHHAHDAFLTNIVGGFLSKRFNINKYGDYRKFAKTKDVERKYSSGYFINSFKSVHVDEDTGEVIWDGPSVIDVLRKAFNYKDCFISKKPEEQTGEFYDQTIYEKTKGKIELKKGLDPEKYGGYSGLKEAYSVIVEYPKNDKLVRELVPIHVQESYFIKDDEKKLREVLLNKLETDRVKILRKKVLKNQLALYKNHPVFITSSKEMDNAKQLLVDQKYVEFIYRLLNNLLEKNEENVARMNELYKYLKDKIYAEYPLYNKIAEKFEEVFPIFENLEFEKKRLFISEMLGVTSTNSAISNFKKFNVPIRERVDRLRFNRIDVDNLEIIDTSVTGVFTKSTAYEL